MLSKPGRKLDKYIHPMLSSPGDEPFDDAHWLFEIKWDGYRTIAECEARQVKLYSRNGLSFHERYPSIVSALQKMKLNAVLDGEMVLFNEAGKPDFQKLQHYEENGHLPLLFYVFDILQLKGENLCNLPLVERKNILKKVLKESSVVRYSDHIEEEGIAFFREAKKSDLEGIMAKKADSIYVPGIRTKDWLKIKNVQTREAIIAGYTEGKGSRKYFGALVLGEFPNKKLRYLGHTGTGFSDKTLKELWTVMQQYRRDGSPFDEKVPLNGKVTWLDPKLVAEVRYAEITRDGILRHPVFLHLREDKEPKEVKPETPSPVNTTSITHRKNEKSKMEKTTIAAKKKNSRGAKTKTTPAAKSNNENNRIVSINRHNVEFSNLNKIYWPEEKITKGDMINYYEAVADYILPYLKDRPLSLKRNPNGINEPGFFHKDAGDIAPSWMKTAKIYSDSTHKQINYLVCNNKESLLFIANLGCIEMNPWNATFKKPENPAWMVIDIDPSDDNTFEDVIQTALVVKSIFDKAGVKSYCKTSGSSGLHVYVPMGARYNYDHVKDFAHLVAMKVTEELPQLTTLTRSLSKRSSNKIYIDYLQNRRGQTLACAYSLRPKPGAPVSMPLDWKEVKPGLHPTDFNIHNAVDRINRKGDLFIPVLGKGIDLLKTLKALEK